MPTSLAKWLAVVRKYAKGHVAAIGSILTWVVATYPDTSWNKWAALGLAFLTAAGVVGTPNYSGRLEDLVPLPRQAGSRGRLPVKAPADRFPIQYLHRYLANPLPAPHYPVNVSGGITNWRMLGNGPDPTCTTHPNGVGDCTFAGREHNRMAKAKAAKLSEKWETSNALVAEYLKYTHGQDVGANIADLLLAWYKAGVIEAFAPVDHTNPAQVDAAMQAFHGAYCGVSLTDDADSLFEAGKPWRLARGQKPDPNEGHCIVKVQASRAQDWWVTWGAQQRSTKEWTAACLDEAWVIITKEDAHLVDIAALRADIDRLHGTGGKVAAKPKRKAARKV